MIRTIIIGVSALLLLPFGAATGVVLGSIGLILVLILAPIIIPLGSLVAAHVCAGWLTEQTADLTVKTLVKSFLLLALALLLLIPATVMLVIASITISVIALAISTLILPFYFTKSLADIISSYFDENYQIADESPEHLITENNQKTNPKPVPHLGSNNFFTSLPEDSLADRFLPDLISDDEKKINFGSDKGPSF